MAFQPVGNGAEAVIKATLDGEQVVTTFPLLGIVGFTQANLQEFVDDLVNAWSTNALPQLPASYQAFEVVGRGLRTASDVEASTSFPSNSTGALVSPQLPNNVTISVARKTGLTGRSNRGRLYWPGLTEGDVVGNELSSTRATAILAALSAIQANVEGPGNFLMAVISRYTGGALRPTAIALPIASWTVVDRTVDSQRRRLPNRGS